MVDDASQVEEDDQQQLSFFWLVSILSFSAAQASTSALTRTIVHSHKGFYQWRPCRAGSRPCWSGAPSWDVCFCSHLQGGAGRNVQASLRGSGLHEGSLMDDSATPQCRIQHVSRPVSGRPSWTRQRSWSCCRRSGGTCQFPSRFSPSYGPGSVHGCQDMLEIFASGLDQQCVGLARLPGFQAKLPARGRVRWSFWVAASPAQVATGEKRTTNHIVYKTWQFNLITLELARSFPLWHTCCFRENNTSRLVKVQEQRNLKEGEKALPRSTFVVQHYVMFSPLFSFVR